MDVIRIHTPSEDHARRLLTSLDGGFSAVISSDGAAPTVALTPDVQTAARLIELFNSLGDWLTSSDLASCQVAFGDRAYTLMAPAGGNSNDPTTFLLERTIQLQTALDSRVVIEQAKGILAERHGISPEEAFEQLRSEARSKRIKLRQLAADIVATTSAKS